MKSVTPFGLRIPDDLKQWLAARAEANCRSMNNELIAMMKAAQAAEQSLERPL
ncbi:Arc family DNA-binding protein [Rhizobium lentis]|uniref:Arc family DNA-binding protein n=1 Tax=Rhizobium lentis TaxID=1138194 RepID=UPI001C834F57|nr:Arc family DNA-binding protein [Rhizobium lentis]MBX5103033.1 Arc family DNA-binding protein [Rhizobium lentis]